jgi:hypothetical protein
VRTRAGYEWTLSATQTIAHRFRVSGHTVGRIGYPARDVSQVGESIFEERLNRVFAYVPEGTDMKKINIEELKLAPEGVAATYNPSLETLLNEPQAFRISDYGEAMVRRVDVTYHGETYEWSLYLLESDVQLVSLDAFARRVYLTGYGADEETNYFEYRTAAGYDPDAADPASHEGWTRVPDVMMTPSGQPGIFSAVLKGLTPETGYLVRAVSGESISEERAFTTEGTRALPGAGLDEWHEGPDDRNAIKTRVQNPWPIGGVWEVDRWWDTGNKGVAMADGSRGNSVASEPGCPANHEGKAAKLESKWALIKAAGGNIYFGEFGEMMPGSDLNATCRLGHTWLHRPTGFKFWYRYYPQPIDALTKEHVALHPWKLTEAQWMGSPDSLHVCVALWADPNSTAQNPFVVNTDTRPGKFVDFARDVDGVIAYGAFVSAARQDTWKEQTIEMEYLKPGPLPKNTQLYLLITSSKNCNYFIVGSGKDTGTGSLMYVDELELLYE